MSIEVMQLINSFSIILLAVLSIWQGREIHDLKQRCKR